MGQHSATFPWLYFNLLSVMSLFLMIKLQWYCNKLSHVFSAFKLSLWWYVNILTWRPSHFCYSSFDHHTLLYFLVLLVISCNTQLNPHKWWQHHLLMVEALFIDQKNICFCVNFNILGLFPIYPYINHHSSEAPVMFDALPNSAATLHRRTCTGMLAVPSPSSG